MDASPSPPFTGTGTTTSLGLGPTFIQPGQYVPCLGLTRAELAAFTCASTSNRQKPYIFGIYSVSSSSDLASSLLLSRSPPLHAPPRASNAVDSATPRLASPRGHAHAPPLRLLPPQVTARVCPIRPAVPSQPPRRPAPPLSSEAPATKIAALPTVFRLAATSPSSPSSPPQPCRRPSSSPPADRR